MATVLIDGDHSYEGVRSDWQIFSPLVRPGGYAILHDCQNERWPGGAQFLRDLVDRLPCGWEMATACDHTLALRKKN